MENERTFYTYTCCFDGSLLLISTSVAGLYVHFPFRRNRHSYDEAYYVVTDRTHFSDFTAALSRELEYYVHQHTLEEPFTTVYVGGGRPSLLPLDAVHGLVRTGLDILDASAIEEATAEIHPADAHPRYLSGLRRLKFNRLSIEVLSFNDKDLSQVDAPHSAAEAKQGVVHAREAGFQELSVDLLFGWPTQSFSNWKATLQQAVALELPHLSLVEAPTEQNGHRAEVEQAKRLEYAMSFLRSEGYEQYELTHFALPNHRSVHQENYYTHGNHLGIGPGAQTFWWTHRTQNPLARRWSNVSDVQRYVDLLSNQYPPVSYRQTLDQTALAQEYVLLRLRTGEGLDLNVLENTYGYDLRAAEAPLLDRLGEEGLIHTNELEHIRLTQEGLLAADAITERLLPE